MPKWLLFTFSLLLVHGVCLSANEDEETAPESDIGLTSESVQPGDGVEIRDVRFEQVSGKPLIDGDVSDPFWEQAHAFNLDTELYPIRFAPAVVETRAWVATTKTHVYIAFYAHDPKPENMRSALRERDATKEDDYVSAIIDLTGNQAKKYEFRVNPHGTLSDLVQDTISERYMYDWDTEWEGAAIIQADGYSVEIAIPVGSIRAPEIESGQDAQGIFILKRSYPRRVDRTMATFFTSSSSANDKGEPDPNSLTSSDRETDGRLKISGHYIFHLDESRPIGGDFEQVSEHGIHGVGMDVEYQLKSSETLQFTINPNFTNVEADIARDSVANPFVVFKPEKRQFFKPATEYYSTLIPTVYTRNIKQPRGGISYVRDSADSSLGSFYVNDRETEVIIPDTFGSEKVELEETSHALAGRYRFSRDRLTFGVIGTARTAEDYHNAVTGIDGLWNIGSDDKLRYQFLYSDSSYPERFADDLCEQDDCTLVPPPDNCPLGNCSVNSGVLRTDFGNPLKGHAFEMRYKHDGPSGLYWAGYKQLSPDFRSDLGFQKQVDIRSINAAFGRKWYVTPFEDDEGKSRFRAYLVGTHTRSYDDNHQLENGLGVWGEFRGSFQSVFRIGKRFRERAVNRINQNSLDTGDNAPLFDENYWQWFYEVSPWANWKIGLDGRIGETADADNLVLGDLEEFKPRIIYRLDKFEFTLSNTYRLFEVDGSTLYRERFGSFTLLYRRSEQVSHRLLYLDDLTERDIDSWLGPELEKEIERTFEYTFIYNPDKKWQILAGIKAEYDFKSDVNDDDITNREVYAKIERKF